MRAITFALLPVALAKPLSRQASMSNDTSPVQTTFYPLNHESVTVTGLSFLDTGIDRYAGIPFAAPRK